MRRVRVFLIAAIATITYSVNAEPYPVREVMADGTIVINTTELTKQITGYDGTTPIKLYVKDGVIRDLVTLPNYETPEYFEDVKKKLPKRWIGLTIEDAKSMEVDVVSGATFSSESVIENVKVALNEL